MTLDVFTQLAEDWSELMLRTSVHGAIAILIVFAFCWLAYNRTSRRAQCWLWRLVFLKFVLLLVLVSPIELPLLPPHSLPAYPVA